MKRVMNHVLLVMLATVLSFAVVAAMHFAGCCPTKGCPRGFR